MRHALGPNTTLSYCTNVHPITDPDALIEQLRAHAEPVRRAVASECPLAIGIYLPLHTRPIRRSLRDCLGAATDLVVGREPPRTRRIEQYFHAAGFEPVTANAFPLEPFQDGVIKHRVYQPDWRVDERADYTRLIIDFLCAHPTPDRSRSVSTLPIGWPHIGSETESQVSYAGEHLREIAGELAEREQEGDCHITVDLEPEPGCILQHADDAITFFDQHLPDESHRNHVGICHDICHTAVMFEDQAEALRKYADAGIRVNKVQISNAIEADFSDAPKAEILAALRPFAEERYLHQTMLETDGRHTFFEDLPDALDHLERSAETPDRLRVHYHVPIYLDRIGPLRTTQRHILPAIKAARELHDCKHFEIETYAWNVLPAKLQRESLAHGIADEFRWVLDNARA